MRKKREICKGCNKLFYSFQLNQCRGGKTCFAWPGITDMQIASVCNDDYFCLDCLTDGYCNACYHVKKNIVPKFCSHCQLACSSLDSLKQLKPGKQQYICLHEECSSKYLRCHICKDILNSLAWTQIFLHKDNAYCPFCANSLRKEARKKTTLQKKLERFFSLLLAPTAKAYQEILGG